MFILSSMPYDSGTIAIPITMAVSNSDTGNASHTPAMPNKWDNNNAQSVIATKPLNTDAINAHPAFSVALKYPVPTMLNPEQRNR